MVHFSIMFNESEAYQVIADMLLQVKYDDPADSIWAYSKSWEESEFSYVFADSLVIKLPYSK